MKYLLVLACLISGALTAMQSSQQVPQEIVTIQRSDRWIDIDTAERTAEIERAQLLNKILFAASENDGCRDIAAFAMGKGANSNYQPEQYMSTAFERAIRSNAVCIAWQMSNYEADFAHGLRVLMDHACITTREDLYKAQRALFARFIARLKEKNKGVDEGNHYFARTALMNIAWVHVDPNGKSTQIPIKYRIEYVKDLIARGADPKKCDRFGLSALNQATKNNLLELIPLLRKK